MDLFVWDFHGVLEMGNEYAVTEVSNNVLEARGYVERFTDGEVIVLYGKKWWEYLMPSDYESVWMSLQSKC